MSANSKELLKFLKSQIGELDDEESQNVDMYAEDNSTIVVTLTDYYESELLSDFAMRLPELANEQGWFITNENELDEAPDQVALYLHPKEGVKVDVPKYVYHVTQSSKVEQILKSGLQPKRGVNNHGFKYPPRVYVASDPQILQNMDLGISGDRTLLKIDTSKIPDIKFYDDPQFPHDGQWRSAYANDADGFEMFEMLTDKEVSQYYNFVSACCDALDKFPHLIELVFGGLEQIIDYVFKSSFEDEQDYRDLVPSLNKRFKQAIE